MMQEALADKYPLYAERMGTYSHEYWAKFTWKVLAHGVQRSSRFIPWPDARRWWKKYLSEKRSSFLEKYLPQQGEEELLPAA
jgi:hypothetical protein